jgi:hypothetical protein
MFYTVSSLPIKRLGLVVHGLAHVYESQFGIARGAQRQQLVNTGTVVHNFNFNFNLYNVLVFRAVYLLPKHGSGKREHGLAHGLFLLGRYTVIGIPVKVRFLVILVI